MQQQDEPFRNEELGVAELDPSDSVTACIVHQLRQLFWRLVRPQRPGRHHRDGPSG